MVEHARREEGLAWQTMQEASIRRSLLTSIMALATGINSRF